MLIPTVVGQDAFVGGTASKNSVFDAVAVHHHVDELELIFQEIRLVPGRKHQERKELVEKVVDQLDLNLGANGRSCRVQARRQRQFRRLWVCIASAFWIL